MKAFLSGASGNGPAVDFEEHLKSLLQDDPLAMAEFEKLTKDVPGEILQPYMTSYPIWQGKTRYLG